jgi:tetratricopeptide (TPR) repeat protein
LKAVPGALVPIGNSKDNFSIGGGVNLTGDYLLPFSQLVFARGEIEFDVVPTLAGTNMTLLSFGGGAGISYNPISVLNLRASVTGGYFLRFYYEDVGGNLFINPHLEINYVLSPSFSLGIGVGYKMYFADPPLYTGMGLSLAAGWNIGARSKKANIEYRDILLEPVFPVFYKYYDENPLGNVTIRNNENGTITNVKVSFFAKRYMDKAKECIVIDKMLRGEEMVIPLYALFSDEILEITEGTKINAEVAVSYDYLGKNFNSDISETVRVYDRNAMTWDDDRKAASFVTAKDPQILRFSKRIAVDIREGSSGAINSNFRMGLGLFEALSISGIGYVIDPKTPYIEFSQNKAALDYLQFPIQTLFYKAGDCDDLSILYSALLESIGIEAAFITVPGHIYAAFALDIPPEEARKTFLTPDDLIFRDNNTWIPVEVTLVKDGFLKAWQEGAKEWRENNSMDTAAFYPVHEAWTLYEPVGMPSEDIVIELPDAEAVFREYSSKLNQFIEMQIDEKVVQLIDKIQSNTNNLKYINKLGVLYARFGMYSEAIAEFKKITDKTNYLSALVNLGNVYYLQEKLSDALSYYNRAVNHSPDHPKVLLGLSLIYFKLERYAEATETYQKLEIEDTVLASKYSYLAEKADGTSRAALSDTSENVVWYDDE